MIEETNKQTFTPSEFTPNVWLELISRNWLWVAIIVISGLIASPNTDILRTLLLICTLEGMAIGLSSIAIHIFTKYNYTKYLIEGDDGKSSSTERYSALNFAGLVVLAVHILVGISFYLLQFNDK